MNDAPESLRDATVEVRATVPNERLIRLLEQSGMSRKALAKRVNELAGKRGLSRSYTHTSVANWCRRGMAPRSPGPELIAEALSERLARRVTVAETGLAAASEPTPPSGDGLGFARTKTAALTEAADYWSHVNRRDFIAGAPFAIGAFSTPFLRWLTRPADLDHACGEGPRVGVAEARELRRAAEEVRHWDSRYGGGSWRTASVPARLFTRAATLLHGTYPERVGSELFAATSQLARLAGWTAFDAGMDQIAQRHFIQALRLARAADDRPLGGYVLTTMAMQALLRGHPHEAVDMTQGAYERVGGGPVAVSVRGFAKLIEARAHARLGDAAAACRCLATAEDLCAKGHGAPDTPEWMDFFGHGRIVTDAVEIFRDLGRPQVALRWDRMTALPANRFTRCHGMRLAIVGTAHAQRGELDEAVHAGCHSLAVLRSVDSERAKEHLRALRVHLAPWRSAPQVRGLLAELPAA
ncbi:sporulation protein [Streptomyces leeuwenhoekii]|uniref:55.5 kDa and 49.5 kDa sporulation proteins n=1 Tax=Streptomyces leeuwenhoekii TaxID=1437453 RepID=A0A0F7VL78_STRLW|nr:sporulation protein [Streptomyces leeuwenhoekii]CQR60159.1 55.5 kDa and 49.5 kDa sporulation proteins [Streptomyces leeuwenhoekii]